MKIKSTKLKIIFFITILVFLFISVSKLISNTDNNFLFKVKSFIPNSIKTHLKNTIFLIPSLNDKIKELEKENKSLKNDITNKKRALKNIKDKYFSGSYPLISFYLEEKDRIIKSKYSNYKLTTFQTSFLDNGKAKAAKASAYLEEYEDKILLANGDGVFSYFYKEDLNKNKFDSITISSNIKEIIDYREFYKKSEDGIKDILIDGNKIFVSFSNQLPDQLPNYCYNTSILVADINFEYLKFNKFFVPDQCVISYEDYERFNPHIAGGRMVDFKDNKILFSTGAFQYFKHPQDKELSLIHI